MHAVKNRMLSGDGLMQGMLLQLVAMNACAFKRD